MDRQQKDVLELHKTLGLEHADSPRMLTERAANRRIRLIDEEFDEFIAAYEEHDLVKMVDALADLLYVVYGTAVEMGVDLEPVWDEVHRSNMTKVGGGQDEYGKGLKPDTYEPPNLRPILAKQLAVDVNEALSELLPESEEL